MKMWHVKMGNASGPVVVFAHGWGRNHEDFLPIVELMAPEVNAILIDLPGFGESERPEEAWGTEDYARFLAKYLTDELGYKQYIWVGHSFGARIGLRLASMTDSPVKKLIIVAGAGLKLPQPLFKSIRGRIRSFIFKWKRNSANSESEVIELEKQYGSADYVQSRETKMRDIFIKTIVEDQTDDVQKINCQTSLLYGAKDTETPPEIGLLLNKLISKSEYIECPEFDHISVLRRGRHQICLTIRDNLEEKVH